MYNRYLADNDNEFRNAFSSDNIAFHKNDPPHSAVNSILSFLSGKLHWNRIDKEDLLLVLILILLYSESKEEEFLFTLLLFFLL